MRRLGHHCYTSVGGYRTLHCSPWLEPLRPLLDERAQTCYAEAGRFDLAHGGGIWLASFVISNGVDHVRRPRNLVHQVVIEEKNIPPIFSPLFLRQVCLDRLDHDDPALEQRLSTDFEHIDLGREMPSPDRFGQLFTGPANPIIVACYEALAHPDQPVRVPVSKVEACLSDLPAALCAPLVHPSAFHLSSLEHPLAYPFQEHAAAVHIRNGGRSLKSSTITTSGLDSPPRVLTEIVARHPQPHRLLLLLRRLPLPQLFHPQGLMQLLHQSLDGGGALNHQGLPQLGTGQGQAFLCTLLRLGGVDVVREALMNWSQSLATRIDPELQDDIDARIIACTSEAELSALAQVCNAGGITL